MTELTKNGGGKAQEKMSGWLIAFIVAMFAISGLIIRHLLTTSFSVRP
ncbi:MAG: hypothetical protein HYW15_03315 [Candidatus Giovannonibacteria bacterium]|nr:MAG: hypothetical protein HYW15_03315 [Candidatus Giovannonibacteria bacterium]